MATYLPAILFFLLGIHSRRSLVKVSSLCKGQLEESRSEVGFTGEGQVGYPGRRTLVVRGRTSRVVLEFGKLPEVSRKTLAAEKAQEGEQDQATRYFDAFNAFPFSYRGKCLLRHPCHPASVPMAPQQDMPLGA